MKTPSRGRISVKRGKYSSTIVWPPGFLCFVAFCCSVRQQISLPKGILVVRHKDYLLKPQRQSSRTILTTAFCHLVFQSAIINDVTIIILIEGCGRKLILQFKEELFYPLVKVRCPYHVPLQRYNLLKMWFKYTPEMGSQSLSHLSSLSTLLNWSTVRETC